MHSDTTLSALKAIGEQIRELRVNMEEQFDNFEANFNKRMDHKEEILSRLGTAIRDLQHSMDLLTQPKEDTTDAQ